MERNKLKRQQQQQAATTTKITLTIDFYDSIGEASKKTYRAMILNNETYLILYFI